MANDSKLVKTILYKSLAEGVYRDVVTKSSSYYYFLGQTLSWEDEDNPPFPVDSLDYEREVRNEIITIKEVKPSDIAFVIKRRDWAPNVVYDMYDDSYCDQVLGINVISGGGVTDDNTGGGYINIEDITITISGGGGTGATAVVSEISDGQISGVILTNPGSGYTSEPTVTVTSASGTGAELKAVIGISSTGKQKLEESDFYVVTDEYNVYKCLDNNNGAYSVNKPSGTQLNPITTADGYIWKFMYNIPINLRNKFYTDEYIPVVSALTNHFYSNGTIDNIYITNRGQNFSSALVSVTGDGYRESDPILISRAQVLNEGTGYTTPTITFTPPFKTSSAFVPSSSVNLGQIIENTATQDFYEVITPGMMSSIPPTHRDGTVLCGTAALKYRGTTLKGELVTRNDRNITRIDLTNAGIQYTSAPTVRIFDKTGVGAVATAHIGTSTIQSVHITSGGTGYSEPTASLIGGGGAGAILSVQKDGNGVITGIAVTSGGAGYTSAPNVIIQDAGGNGTGAIVEAILSGSPVTDITVDEGGTGYSETAKQSTGTGVITTLTSSAFVEGVGTLFTTEVTVGQSLKKQDGTFIGTVKTIIDNTNLELQYSAAVALSSSVFDIWNGVTIAIVGGGGTSAKAQAVIETNVIDSVLLNGGIREIVIIQSGSGYLTAPDVEISGGGGQYAVVRSKLYADRVLTTHVVNPGEGYKELENDPLTVTFGTSWEQGLEVYTNDQFSNGGYLYTVSENGFFGHIQPSWTFNMVNGVKVPITNLTSVEWEAATEVVAGETVWYGVTQGQTTVKYLYEILENGYTSTTPPQFLSGDGSSSTYGVGLRFIGKVASLTWAGTVATGRVVLRYGAGYSENPQVTISDPAGSLVAHGAEVGFLTSKSEAKISAIVDNGQIVYLVVDDAGTGYTKANLTVTPEENGAILTADLSLGAISSQQANNEILTPAGTIDAIQIISGGYGYGVANIAIYGDGTGATAEAVLDPITNAITKVNITNRGQDYTYAEVQVIGNGSAANLRAIISPYGGHGKNSPDELFSRSLMFYTNISNDLNQGVVVANDYRQVGIIKDPRVFDGYERYQGAIGSACYIIQAPIQTTRFGRDDELYIERVNHPSLEWQPSLYLQQGTFLWYEDRIYTVVVSGDGGSTPPTFMFGSNSLNDSVESAVLTYVGSTKSKKRYRIVSLSSTFALVQSLDNDIPKSNDVLIKASNITDNFTVVSVGLPSFDKFSGQVLYIDNKQGFTPSSDETITLRTIVQF